MALFALKVLKRSITFQGVTVVKVVTKKIPGQEIIFWGVSKCPCANETETPVPYVQY